MFEGHGHLMARLIVITDGDIDGLTRLRTSLIQRDHRFVTRDIVDFADLLGRVIWAPVVERRLEHDESCGG